VAAGLLLVFGLLVAALVLLRRHQARTVGRPRPGTVRVIGRTAVGRRSSLLLVEVGGRRVLVGATPTTLSALSEWEEADEAFVDPREARQPESARFDSLLGRVLERLRALDGGAP
jgi:flagellar biogenesis protein FliO